MKMIKSLGLLGVLAVSAYGVSAATIELSGDNATGYMSLSGINNEFEEENPAIDKGFQYPFFRNESKGYWEVVVAEPLSAHALYPHEIDFNVEGKTVTDEDFSQFNLGDIEYEESLVVGEGLEIVPVSELTLTLDASEFDPLTVAERNINNEFSWRFVLEPQNLSGTGLTFLNGVLRSIDIKADVAVGIQFVIGDFVSNVTFGEQAEQSLVLADALELSGNKIIYNLDQYFDGNSVAGAFEDARVTNIRRGEITAVTPFPNLSYSITPRIFLEETEDGNSSVHVMNFTLDRDLNEGETVQVDLVSNVDQVFVQFDAFALFLDPIPDALATGVVKVEDGSVGSDLSVIRVTIDERNASLVLPAFKDDIDDDGNGALDNPAPEATISLSNCIKCVIDSEKSSVDLFMYDDVSDIPAEIDFQVNKSVIENAEDSIEIEFTALKSITSPVIVTVETTKGAFDELDLSGSEGNGSLIVAEDSGSFTYQLNPPTETTIGQTYLLSLPILMDETEGCETLSLTLTGATEGYSVVSSAQQTRVVTILDDDSQSATSCVDAGHDYQAPDPVDPDPVDPDPVDPDPVDPGDSDPVDSGANRDVGNSDSGSGGGGGPLPLFAIFGMILIMMSRRRSV